MKGSTHDQDAKVRKRCSCCGEVRPLHRFRADPRARGGLRSQCALCESAAERARYWRRKAGGTKQEQRGAH